MRVYFAGAFSEGKTTLKNKVAAKYNLFPIPEQIRVLAAEKDIDNLQNYRINTDNVTKLQEETLLRQYETEKLYGKNLASCRCLDSVAFLAFFGRKGSFFNFRNSNTYLEYVSWLREPDAHIFYILPQKNLLSGDGFRDTDWELGLQISGAVRMILEVEGLDYIPISTSSSADREKIIFSYLDKVTEHENINKR